MALAPGDTLGGYRIDGVVGRGGMGIIYRATQLRLERVVALKVIAPDLADDPGFRERFEREARTAARLEHPHVVPVYEADEADGRLFLAMRFIDGTDLKSLVQVAGRLEPARAARLVGQVAEALDAAHDLGLVHRDVKPANVLVSHAGTARETAYLTDFGLVKGEGTAELTQTGQWVGTLAYAAPEQLRGEQATPRTDVYALGCVLQAMLTGQPPFPRESDAAMLFAHLSEPPPAPSACGAPVPPALDAVVMRALAKDAADRWPSAGAFGRAARDALERPSAADGETAAGALPSDATQARPVVAGTGSATAPAAGIGTGAGALDATAPAAGGSSFPETRLESDPTGQPPTRLESDPTGQPPTRLETPGGGPAGGFGDPPTAVGGAAAAGATAAVGDRRRGSRAGGIAILAGLLVVLGVVLAVVLGGGDEEPSSRASTAGSDTGTTSRERDRRSSERRSSRDGRPPALAAEVGERVRVGGRPDGVAADGDDLWVALAGEGAVAHVDVAESRRVAVTPTGRGADSVALTSDRVWVTNTEENTVTSVARGNPEDRREIRVGRGPEGIAAGPGAVYVANGDGTISVIPRAGGQARSMSVLPGEALAGLALGRRGLWATVPGRGQVLLLDPGRGTVLATVDVGGEPRGVAASGGRVYVTSLDKTADNLTGFPESDPSDLRQTYGGRQPLGVTVAGGVVWTAAQGKGFLGRYDRRTLEDLGGLEVGGQPLWLAPTSDGLWVSRIDQGDVVPVRFGG